MKTEPVLSGHVLPTVLVVGTLTLLAVMAVMALLDTQTWLVHGHLARRQKEAWLESALLLYEQDSTLAARLDENHRFRLFEDDPVSEITLARRMWGLYELIRVSTEDQKYRKAQLTGYAAESPKKAALYVADNERAFTIAGKTRVEGRIYLPQSGLLYGQVQSEFYSGRPLPEDHIRHSDRRLPALNQPVMDSLNRLWHHSGTSSVPPAGELRNSFFEPTVWLTAGNLSQSRLYGNIVVRSAETIEIDSTCRLEDVLLIAPKVIVREGFSGSLQIVATDSVVIAGGVELKYPSGIVIPQAAADSFIEIGPQSEVNGYVILQTACEIPPEKRTAQVRQDVTSRTRGLVWIDGIAELQGTVTGSLYATELHHYTAQGIYMNLLYRISVYRSGAMAFPLWMNSDYRRKGAKWVE